MSSVRGKRAGNLRVPAQRTPGTGQLHSLTGVRFIAALMVFLFHIIYEAPFENGSVAHWYDRCFNQAGRTGVAFFFVLSGFVLTWSARPEGAVGRFWQRRLTKVFPNHLITYLAAIILTLAAGLSLGGWKFLPGLLLIQSWFPQPDIETSANPVAWSLSCEIFFYLCFPFLLRAISRINARHLWYWAGAVAGLVWCVPLIGRLILPARPVASWAPSVSTYEFWFVYVFPPTRMLEFILGMLMARILLSGQWIRLPLSVAALLALGVYVVAPEAPDIYSVVAVTVIPIALLVPAAAVLDLEERRSLLSSRVMVRLGELSFAFYLWHRLVLSFGHRALGITEQWPTWEVAVLAALAFAVVVALSWLTFTFVEQPAMRWIGGRTGRSPVRQHMPVPVDATMPVARQQQAP